MEDQLRRLLDELRVAVDHTDTTAESRAELRGLVEAIEARLESSEGDDEGLGESLNDAALRFETEHPSLGETLRSVVHGLGASGI